MMNDEQKKERREKNHVISSTMVRVLRVNQPVTLVHCVWSEMASPLLKENYFFLLDVIKVEGGFLSMGCC